MRLYVTLAKEHEDNLRCYTHIDNVVCVKLTAVLDCPGRSDADLTWWSWGHFRRHDTKWWIGKPRSKWTVVRGTTQETVADSSAEAQHFNEGIGSIFIQFHTYPPLMGVKIWYNTHVSCEHAFLVHVFSIQVRLGMFHNLCFHYQIENLWMFVMMAWPWGACWYFGLLERDIYYILLIII